MKQENKRQTANLHCMLQHPLNMAHALDRRAEHFMSLQPPNYSEAIKAHQRARAMIDEVLMTERPDPHEPFLNGPKKPLLVSLYGQKQRHVYMQNVILSKQQKALQELKESPYIATARETKTELALLDAHRQEQQRIEKVYREQTELYDSLDENLNRDGEMRLAADGSGAQWSPMTGKKKPKSYEETIEELRNTQSHFKFLSDQYATAIMQMKAELMSIKQEQTDSHTVSPYLPANIISSTTESSTPLDSLESPSLEKPAPFALPDGFLERLTDRTKN